MDLPFFLWSFWLDHIIQPQFSSLLRYMFLDFSFELAVLLDTRKNEKSKSDIIVFVMLFLGSTETRLKAEINPNC